MLFKLIPITGLALSAFCCYCFGGVKRIAKFIGVNCAFYGLYYCCNSYSSDL
jgi:hypothetical protein